MNEKVFRKKFIKIKEKIHVRNSRTWKSGKKI